MMSNHLVPVTDARDRLAELIRDAESNDVTLLRHGRPVAYLIGVERYEALLDQIDDLGDRLAAFESAHSEPDLRVPLEKVKAELGLMD